MSLQTVCHGHLNTDIMLQKLYCIVWFRTSWMSLKIADSVEDPAALKKAKDEINRVNDSLADAWKKFETKHWSALKAFK